MITEQDLQEAIAECQGIRNPTASTCLKLASFLTIQEHLFGNNNKEEEMPKYSFAPEPDTKVEQVINYESDTEFAQLINGRKANEIWKIVDELVSVIEATNPRLYNGFIRKIDS